MRAGPTGGKKDNYELLNNDPNIIKDIIVEFVNKIVIDFLNKISEISDITLEENKIKAKNLLYEIEGYYSDYLEFIKKFGAKFKSIEIDLEGTRQYLENIVNDLKNELYKFPKDQIVVLRPNSQNRENQFFKFLIEKRVLSFKKENPTPILDASLKIKVLSDGVLGGLLMANDDKDHEVLREIQRIITNEDALTALDEAIKAGRDNFRRTTLSLVPPSNN